ncbi:MAG: RING finger protein [Nitrososphaeraceae archaeon]|nr:RING finger protein [Nitrososphaeraceae archaeon]
MNDAEECSVCLNEIKEFIQLSCKHLFCESCIDQIKKNNQIKCPLCRNMQDVIESYNLSHEDKDIILNEFSNSMEQYRTFGGRNFMSFELIIQDIAEKKGIKLNLV